MPIKYDDRGAIKRPNKKINMTPEQAQHYINSVRDPTYFAEKFYNIITPKGKMVIKLYDYQKMLLQNFVNNKYCITLSSRQSGKCVHIDTKIIIKNIHTKIEEEITIGELFERIVHVKEKEFNANNDLVVQTLITDIIKRIDEKNKSAI